MKFLKVLEYSSFLLFVIGALLFLFQYTFLGTLILVLAIIFRGIYVVRTKNLKDKKEEYDDVIDNLDEE